VAANSTREQIIQYVITQLESLSSISTVERKLPAYSDLTQFAVTQFPVVAVVGRLPQPEPKYSSRQKYTIDKFLSKLIVDLYVYIQNNVNPDSDVSSLADDIWATFYSDLSMGGLVEDLSISLDERVEYWEPFMAFHAAIKVHYFHDVGGI